MSGDMKLSVYLHDQKVGQLKQVNSGLMSFAYDKQWLKQPNAIPISKSLPLQEDRFDGTKTRPFFAGVLPEGYPRKRIAEIIGVSESNDFALLENIGGECAGAIRLLPESSVLMESGQPAYQELSQMELQKVVHELHERPLLAGKDGIRLSLAGAQDKLPVILHNGKICLSVGDSPSTHILKPEPERFPGLAANELFCMLLANKIGLNVPDIEFRQIGDKASILVQRYDRQIDQDGTTCRLHQEDFCQALGFPPEKKYQAEGGPTLVDSINLLREWSSIPVKDIPHFINLIIFNVLIGNADAHGKNFSILYTGKQRRLAPCYDLVSTLIWPVLSKKLAMKIGHCDSINTFDIGDWKKMSKILNLGWPLIRERIRINSDLILNNLDEVRERSINYNESMPHKLHELISSRAQKMLDALVKPGH